MRVRPFHFAGTWRDGSDRALLVLFLFTCLVGIHGGCYCTVLKAKQKKKVKHEGSSKIKGKEREIERCGVKEKYTRTQL